ncbi:monocarboxylate transporter 12, partial [Trichonephila inaurata madagascariensis]
GVPLEEGVFLVSAFSIGDFAGRLSFGWITDTQCMKRNVLVRLYLVAMGSLTACLPICPNSALPVFSILLGILNGSVIVNHSVLLNEYLGIEKLPLAIGFSTCFVGMTAFIRPMIIGLFRDKSESYDHLFIFIGLLQISITLIWFIENVLTFVKQKFFVNKIVQ